MLKLIRKFVVAYALCLLGVSACRSPAIYPPDKTAAVNGTRLAYTESGRGAPVVFVHGALSDTRAWAGQKDAIASQFRFIAYSMRYHSPNDWQDDGSMYNIPTHASDLAAFVKSLNTGPVHLVGHSFGGHVAAQVAMEHPELVKSLVLEEASIFTVLDSPGGKAVVEAFFRSVPSIKAELNTDGSAKATEMMIDSVLEDPQAWEKAPPLWSTMWRDNAKTLGPFLSAAPPPIDCSRVGTIKAPTLIIEGANSARFFHEIDSKLLQCIAGSERVSVPKADHLVQVRDAEAVNEAILGFLTRHP
ncbi:alpha/beta fold hydrolase [Caballeronia humi]|uniref:Alpha/beta hydrolase n=1 Tax=Caballeronia humi TaxID=326474 RepID=A0A158JEY1_9BURK|nr:alpha/beta hydrolase [Caballeronia humi]SAL67406.1 alpha/beta hydrolase [Caballeronia humi]